MGERERGREGERTKKEPHVQTHDELYRREATQPIKKQANTTTRKKRKLRWGPNPDLAAEGRRRTSGRMGRMGIFPCAGGSSSGGGRGSRYTNNCSIHT